eukprot:6189887-Pleurochrysis_carterae.AAC.1
MSALSEKQLPNLLITTRPTTSGAHDYTVGTEASSPLDHGVARRFGVSTQECEGTAQRRINASAKTCKCE